jgi:hypothetical protein
MVALDGEQGAVHDVVVGVMIEHYLGSHDLLTIWPQGRNDVAYTGHYSLLWLSLKFR